VLNDIGWGVLECLMSQVMEHTGEDPRNQVVKNVVGAARGCVGTNHDIWRVSM
jgi:hypothetical protein